jgi:putative nucleotidyltransferase with HDIG domain
VILWVSSREKAQPEQFLLTKRENVNPEPIQELKDISQLLPKTVSSRLKAATLQLEGERGALNALSSIGGKLAGVRDVFDATALLEAVLKEAVVLMQGDRAALALVEPTGLRVVASRSRDSEEDVTVSQTFLERVVKKAQAIVTTDVQEDPSQDASASILALDIRSVIAVPLRSRDEVIGVLYVDTLFKQRMFSAVDATMLATFAAQAGVAVMLARSVQQDHERNVNFIKTMLTTLDARDPYTAGHSNRVGDYTLKLSKVLGWKVADQERALFAGWVHDIGKIGIRDEFLFKKEPLSAGEREIIEEHSVIGEKILNIMMPENQVILGAVRHHHERWDGKGYPDRLEGESIPILARMISLADTFDAMTTARPYSTPKTWERGFEILRLEIAKQFAPDLVEPFIRAISDDTVGSSVGGQIMSLPIGFQTEEFEIT